MKCLWKKLYVCAAVLLMLTLSGCSGKEPEGKIRDMEFTVIEEDAVPRALADVIAENREKEMKLSYQNEGYLYIARGFGTQTTGGYSIAVRECYLAEDGVHVKFELLGPPNGKDMKEEASYPYIVIKTEAVEGPIIFE